MGAFFHDQVLRDEYDRLFQKALYDVDYEEGGKEADQASGFGNGEDGSSVQL